MSRSEVHTYEVFGETECAGAVWPEQGGHMRNLQVRITLVLAAGLALASCGADPTNFGTLPADLTSNKITGNVHEWGIDVSAHKATAGDVTFAIANFGSIPHEFIVVKTDYELGKIPVGANNRFDEEGDAGLGQYETFVTISHNFVTFVNIRGKANERHEDTWFPRNVGSQVPAIAGWIQRLVCNGVHKRHPFRL